MAFAWWIVGILAFVAMYLIIFKFQDFMYLIAFLKKNIFIILALGLVLFLSFSLYRIHNTYDVDITSYEGISTTGKLYWLWIKGVFVNLGRVTGYAVQQDWFLDSTNSTR